NCRLLSALDAALRRLPWRAADLGRNASRQVGTVGEGCAAASTASASATSATRDADLPGRIGDPGDGDLPAAAASAAATASAGAGTGLTTEQPVGRGLAIGGALFLRVRLAIWRRPA